MIPNIAFDLAQLFELRFFSNLDYHFARTMGDLFKEDDPVILTSCALVSRALSHGHICVDIPKVANTTQPIGETGEEKLTFPDKNNWIKALNSSKMVSGFPDMPLVLDKENRLFLAKYYDFQVRLAESIAKRSLLTPFWEDAKQIEICLKDAFCSNDPNTFDQENAVRHSLLNHFTIISGGPGTGKTYVTSRIRQILFSLFKKSGKDDPKIISVAPTGKAASKMEQGSTIHSVLKPRQDRLGFYHNKDNPLVADAVIIDEASMIDIILLTRLLESIPFSARVILLGDRHQLASVQAGSVFADICSSAALASHTFVLKYNFRSKGKSGIENLSKAINENNEDRVEQILSSSRFSDIVFEESGEEDLEKQIAHQIEKGYHSFYEAQTIDHALEELERFKVLCAHNSGRYGTLQINHLCENILRSKTNSDIQGDHFKRVVMIEVNDYQKGLFNGDTCIISEGKGAAAAYIKNQDGKIIKYRVADLPGHKPAFAITIHKSQGSEFKTVLILLPDKLSPVVTRQLLYTGVTRAKEKVIITGKMEIIKKAISHTVSHNSGLTGCLEACIHDLKQILKKDN